MKRLLYILLALTVLQIGLHLTEIIIDINTHIVHLLKTEVGYSTEGTHLTLTRRV